MKRDSGQTSGNWFRCMVDDHDHVVIDAEFARGPRRHSGRCRAVCGHTVLLGSALLPPAPRCTGCATYIREHALVDPDECVARRRRERRGVVQRLMGRVGA